MSATANIRAALASLLVSAASLYTCLLGVILMMKGATHQVEVQPAIYWGIAAAAALTAVGYWVVRSARDCIPEVLALVFVGALAGPLVMASSWSHRQGHWALVVVFAAVPFAIVALGGFVQRRLHKTEGAGNAV